MRLRIAEVPYSLQGFRGIQGPGASGLVTVVCEHFQDTSSGPTPVFMLREVPWNRLHGAPLAGKRRYRIRYEEQDEDLLFSTETSRVRLNMTSGIMEIALNPTVTDDLDRVLLAHLRLAVSLNTIHRGGVPLHSAAAVRGSNDTASVFTARSGGGKSTIISLLCPPWKPLGDDCHVLLPRNGHWRVFPTPFVTPELLPDCLTQSFVIDRIFAIEHGEKNEMLPLSSSRKYQAVLEGVYTLPTTERLGTAVMDNTAALAAEVPVVRLRVRKDREFREWFETHREV